MKQYGFNKATEFTKKQINVIYGMAKRNELQVEKWIITELYDLADFYGYDDNGSVASDEVKVLKILEKAFAKELEECQNLINEFTQSKFERLGNKVRNNLERCYL